MVKAPRVYPRGFNDRISTRKNGDTTERQEIYWQIRPAAVNKKITATGPTGPKGPTGTTGPKGKGTGRNPSPTPRSKPENLVSYPYIPCA